jgi:hypothetical protein
VAFTYDLSTSRGKVRLGLADKRAESAIFTDAEIDHFLSTGGTVDEAINEGLRVLIAAHAAKGDTDRVDALSAVLAQRGGDLPTLSVGEGAALPTDDAYESP